MVISRFLCNFGVLISVKAYRLFVFFRRVFYFYRRFFLFCRVYVCFAVSRLMDNVFFDSKKIIQKTK